MKPVRWWAPIPYWVLDDPRLRSAPRAARYLFLALAIEAHKQGGDTIPYVNHHDAGGTAGLLTWEEGDTADYGGDGSHGGESPRALLQRLVDAALIRTDDATRTMQVLVPLPQLDDHSGWAYSNGAPQCPPPPISHATAQTYAPAPQRPSTPAPPQLPRRSSTPAPRAGLSGAKTPKQVGAAIRSIRQDFNRRAGRFRHVPEGVTFDAWRESPEGREHLESRGLLRTAHANSVAEAAPVVPNGEGVAEERSVGVAKRSHEGVANAATPVANGVGYAPATHGYGVGYALGYAPSPTPSPSSNAEKEEENEEKREEGERSVAEATRVAESATPPRLRPVATTATPPATPNAPHPTSIHSDIDTTAGGTPTVPTATTAPAQRPTTAPSSPKSNPLEVLSQASRGRVQPMAPANLIAELRDQLVALAVDDAELARWGAQLTTPEGRAEAFPGNGQMVTAVVNGSRSITVDFLRRGWNPGEEWLKLREGIARWRDAETRRAREREREREHGRVHGTAGESGTGGAGTVAAKPTPDAVQAAIVANAVPAHELVERLARAKQQVQDAQKQRRREEISRGRW